MSDKLFYQTQIMWACDTASNIFFLWLLSDQYTSKDMYSLSWKKQRTACSHYASSFLLLWKTHLLMYFHCEALSNEYQTKRTLAADSSISCWYSLDDLDRSVSLGIRLVIQSAKQKRIVLFDRYWLEVNTHRFVLLKYFFYWKAFLFRISYIKRTWININSN
jgi:hypothetical protein